MQTPAPSKHPDLDKRINYAPLTRDDCDSLELEGKLPQWYELVDGEVFRKQHLTRMNGMASMRIISALFQIWPPEQILIRELLEIHVDDRTTNFPMPDIYVSASSMLTYSSDICGHDTLLVVEVTDSTLGVDLTKKLALYAKAGVAELWVLDVPIRCLYSYREPSGGVYASITVVKENEMIALLSAPNQAVYVSNLLPPAESAD